MLNPARTFKHPSFYSNALGGQLFDEHVAQLLQHHCAVHVHDVVLNRL
jgi:hypothetical protein